MFRCAGFLIVSLFSLQAFAGEMRLETVESKALDVGVLAEKGVHLKVNVLLPDGYEGSDKAYPVIYLLHGYGGDYTEWQRVGIEEEAKGVEAIIVMPEGDKSFYFNHHGAEKGRWDDYISKEVVGLVDSKYRTIKSRKGRGISGLSMGGYGAVTLGLKHPELFGSIASHSGAVGILQNDLGGGIGDRINEIFGPKGSKERDDYDPLALIDKLSKSERPHIYIDCGSSDFLLGQNRALVAALSERKVDYEYREVPGQHDFAYWKRNVRYSLVEQVAALAAMPEPPADPRAIVGTWKAISGTPDGNTVNSTVEISFADKKYKATSLFEGREPREMTRCFFRKSSLEMELEFERDDQKVIVRVEAKLSSNKLAGKWMFNDEDGNELASGEWNAEKEAPKKSALVGEWDVIIEFSEDQKIDYEMKVDQDGDTTSVVLISPRSGEYKSKSAEIDGDKIEIKVDREIQGNDVEITYSGELKDGKLSGSMTIVSDQGNLDATWTASKKK